MDEVCIVACSKKKIWDYNPGAGKVPAREAYRGTLTRLAMMYAEMFYKDRWCILSAKYGFLKPDMLIEPYDKTFRNTVLTREIIERLRRQAEELELTKYSSVLVLGGKAYVEVCKKVFQGKIIHAPLLGLGYFRAVKLLKEAITRRVRLEELTRLSNV